MPTIRQTYDNPRTTTRDPVLLARRAGVLVASAREFLRKEGSASINKKWRKPPGGSPAYAPTGAPKDHWQADVIWIPAYKAVIKDHTAILTVLNTTTRFAIARPVMSNKGVDVAPAMESILEELRKSRPKKLVHTLRLDGGSEFKAETAVLLAARKIVIEPVEPFTHAKLSRTDRFHRTLRERLGAHFQRTKSHVWINALEDIVGNINETKHTTLSRVVGQEEGRTEIESDLGDEIPEQHEHPNSTITRGSVLWPCLGMPLVVPQPPPSI